MNHYTDRIAHVTAFVRQDLHYGLQRQITRSEERCQTSEIGGGKRLGWPKHCSHVSETKSFNDWIVVFCVRDCPNGISMGNVCFSVCDIQFRSNDTRIHWQPVGIKDTFTVDVLKKTNFGTVHLIVVRNEREWHSNNCLQKITKQFHIEQKFIGHERLIVIHLIWGFMKNIINK